MKAAIYKIIHFKGWFVNVVPVRRGHFSGLYGDQRVATGWRSAKYKESDNVNQL